MRKARRPVQLKGVKGGLVAYLDRVSPLEEIKRELASKLQEGGLFFKGARVRIDLGGRQGRPEEIHDIKKIFTDHGLMVDGITPGGEPSPHKGRKEVERSVREGKALKKTRVKPRPNGRKNMGDVWVVTSGKGGVGKTTTTANLGTGLAMAGKRVVLVDADIGLRNLDVVMGLENRIIFDLVDVVENRCRLKQALIRDKRYENLFLLPASQAKDKTAVEPEQMKTLCETLARDHDYVMVDCPAGIEQGFRNAIAGANRAVIVTTPEVSAVRDADRIIGLLEAAQLENPRLIVNRLKPDMVRRGDMMNVEDIREILAVELLGVVPDDEAIIVSTNKGEPIVIRSSSLAGQAFLNISQRIMGQQVPFLELDRPRGFLQRLKTIMGMGSRA